MLDFFKKVEEARTAYLKERDEVYEKHRAVLYAAENALAEAAEAEGLSGIINNVTFDLPGGWNANRYPNLKGNVIHDFKGRFYSNESISTSRLQKVYVKDGRTFAKTAFSLYELIDFKPTEIPEDFRYAFEEL